MMKKIIRTLSAVSFVILSMQTGHAAFDYERLGARAIGLGGAFTAVANNSDALLYNSAGLGLIYASSLSANYAQLLTGLDDGALSDSHLAYIHPTDELGTFGISWYQRNLAELYQENLISLGYGLALDYESTYFIGTTLKIFNVNYLDSEVVDSNPYFNGGAEKFGFSFDVGGLAYLTEDWSVGLSASNITQPDMAVGSGLSKVPLMLRVGTAYRLDRVLGSADVLIKNKDLRLSMGLESWWFEKVFGTRAGFASGNNGLAEVSGGISIQLHQISWGLQLDYAFVAPLGEAAGLGGSHQLSLQFLFGSGYVDEDELEGYRLVEEGEKSFKSGDKEEAIAFWEEALEYLPENQSVANRLIQTKEAFRLSSEVRLYLKQGKSFESKGNYINAANEYNKVLALVPNHVEATQLLTRTVEKVRSMSTKQQKQQKAKEARIARREKRENLKKAKWKLFQAEKVLARIHKDRFIAEPFKVNLDKLDNKLADAKVLFAEGESEQTQVLAQNIISEVARLEKRVKKMAVKRTAKKKIKPRYKKKSRKSVVVPQKASKTPASVQSKSVVKKTSSSKIKKAKIHSDKLRKKARGAYGRSVKLMMDIEKLGGISYFPSRYKGMRKELARTKAMLKRKKYSETISASQLLFPKLRKLKKACEEKEKARRALPTGW